jgi:hypothetical protein
MKRDGVRHTVSQTMGRIGLDFCRVGESREFDGSIGLDRGKVPQAKVPRDSSRHGGVRGTSGLKILSGKMLSVRYGSMLPRLSQFSREVSDSAQLSGLRYL